MKMGRGRPRKAIQQQNEEEIQQGIEISSVSSSIQRPESAWGTLKTKGKDEGKGRKHWPNLQNAN